MDETYCRYSLIFLCNTLDNQTLYYHESSRFIDTRYKNSTTNKTLYLSYCTNHPKQILNNIEKTFTTLLYKNIKKLLIDLND